MTNPAKMKQVMTNARAAELITRMMEDCRIGPDQTFTAAAGREYGQVSAWQLPDYTGYAIKYGDNGQTSYDIVDHKALDGDLDLASWLEADTLDKLDTYINIAGVRGIAVVDAAEPTDEGPFAVLISRDYYGPYSATDYVLNNGSKPQEFATYADAQAWIDEAAAKTYRLSHNESNRPTYKIVTL